MTDPLSNDVSAQSRVHADSQYTWSCDVHTPPDLPAITAEQWLRAVWEDAPSPLRAFLRFGWRYGLGLKLSPVESSAHILGWNVQDSSMEHVTVDARSPLLDASNTVHTTGEVLQWTTRVDFKNVFGRLVWAPASLVHQRLVPWSIRRTIHDRQSRSSDSN